MTMVLVFTRAGTDDASVEVEVEDVVFDFDCVEDATTDRIVARIEQRHFLDHGPNVFVPVGQAEWFDTLTVVPRREAGAEAALERIFAAFDKSGNVPMYLADVIRDERHTKEERR